MVAETVTISSLKREKDDATEVRDGYECGLTLTYNDIKEGDVIEAYELVEKERVVDEPLARRWLTCGRARRLSKRIGTVVASAIEFEIKDPPLAFVTITDTKVTGDLHDATVFYTVRGETLQDEPDYDGCGGGAGAGQGHRCAPRSAPAPVCGSPRRWRSCWTRCRRPPRTWRNCWPGAGGRRRTGADSAGRDAGGRRRPVPCDWGGGTGGEQ